MSSTLMPGDGLRLKPAFVRDVSLSTDLSDWQGRVAFVERGESPADALIYAISDGPFLDGLSEAELEVQLQAEGMTAMLVLPAEKAEPAESRDSLAAQAAALDRFLKRVNQAERRLFPEQPTQYERDPSFARLWHLYLSPSFWALTPEAQALAPVVVSQVARYAQFFYETSLADLEGDALQAVLLQRLPEKFFSPEGFYTFLPQVLDCYLALLADHGWAETAGLRQALAEVAVEVEEQGDNPDQWGALKRLIMAMEAHGYDPDDEAEMDAFLAEHGEAMGLSGEAVMTEMLEHPDISLEDQAQMLGELLATDDLDEGRKDGR
jgi:hypothetical protein